MSYPTAARWANHRHTPHPHGDPRNPLIGPIDTSVGPRRQRIPIDSISPSYLATQPQHDRLARIRAEPPTGWRDEHWKAPEQLV